MLWRKSNDVVVRVCTAIYIDMQKHHCEKAEMGLDDPKLVSVHVSFDVWVHAICALFFKGGQVLLFCNCVKWQLSFKVIYLSIHRGATAGSILSLTTDNMHIIMFPGF